MTQDEKGGKHAGGDRERQRKDSFMKTIWDTWEENSPSRKHQKITTEMLSTWST